MAEKNQKHSVKSKNKIVRVSSKSWKIIYFYNHPPESFAKTLDRILETVKTKTVEDLYRTSHEE